ncbi:MAG: hypothetical protein ACQES9_11605 [Myxococcota bacterium]
MNNSHLINSNIFNILKEFLEHTLGTIGFDRFRELLPTTERLLLYKDYHEKTWINARSFSIILAAIDIHLTHQISGFGVQFGRYLINVNKKNFADQLDTKNGKLGLELLQDIFNWNSENSPDFFKTCNYLFQMLQENKNWFKPFKIIQGDKITEDEFHIILEKRPVIIPLFCEVFIGFLLELLNMLKAGHITVMEEQCITEGHDACVFSLFKESSQVDFI